jgi:hypothetical protein
MSSTALDKEAGKGAHWCSLCRALVQQTLVKERVFAECLLKHSVKGLAKGLTTAFFAER